MLSRMKPVRAHMLLQYLMYSWNIRKLLRMMEKNRAVSDESLDMLDCSPSSDSDSDFSPGSDSESSGSEYDSEVSSGLESEQESESNPSG